ncbi:MAG: hypothetical protein NTW96_25915 [Planctomycetia bacterium]|nr:hypothetical protein [Planctomycetia bacterium]
MPHPELAHLELLAEVDSLVERLRRWADGAPAWQPAEACRAVVARLVDRTRALRVRLEAPLIVATLGGTGTGKSALVNALVGAEVVRPGRQRPTTTRPTLICRSDLTPGMLGIDRRDVEVVPCNLPALANLVLLDCPDPDTTEEPDAGGTNLARLRKLLPHCDVLLVTTTQQKYRSARVADELAAAASGARLVFVQPHADQEEDIREDWQAVLGRQYTTGHVFLVDSLAAAADAAAGVEPRGEFAGLVDLLTRQLAGTAPARIRRANFLDLVGETLDGCENRIREGVPAIKQLETAIDAQRSRLAARLADQMRAELLTSRRQWENRLLGKIASCWGFSPWSLVLRVYQGLGGLLSGTLLLRARTPAQLALWGTMEGARTWQRRRRQRQADAGIQRAVAGGWDEAELRSASMVLEGYAVDAGLGRGDARLANVTAEAADAGAAFVENVSVELESLLARLAARHTGWFTRWRYELLFSAMIAVLLYRLGKNFFWDSWLADPPAPGLGLDFYLSAAFWLLLWVLLLLWAFTSRLRRGLRQEINQLAENWHDPRRAVGVFARLEADCQAVERFQDELGLLKQQVAAMRHHLAQPDEPLGHRR